MRKDTFHTAVQVIAIIVLVLQFIHPLAAFSPPGKSYLVDSWDISAGTTSNTIVSIAQTADGYLWLATANELVRFDGIRFTSIPFIEQIKIHSAKEKKTDILTLCIDRKGLLWFANTTGLTCYNYSTGRFRTVTPDIGITWDRVRVIKEDMKGNLWISFFSDYVCRLKHNTFTYYNNSHGLEGKKINAIVEDHKGNLFFATRDNGVFIFRDSRFYRFPITGLDNVSIITMHEDAAGDLWVGTTNGLFRINRTTDTIAKYSKRDGLADNYITRICEDSNRNLWVGSLKGLNQITMDQGGIHVSESLLQSFIITCLLQDREKNLWAGTFNSGIKRLKEGKFTNYAPGELKSEIPTSLSRDMQGNTWVGTLAGILYRCRGSRVMETIQPPHTLGSAITAAAVDKEGNLWFGTSRSGVLKKTGNSLLQLTRKNGLADNLVTSIFHDSKGNSWFSTPEGVSRYRNGIIISYDSTDGLLSNVVHNVYEDSNKNIWIAGDNGITVIPEGRFATEDIAHYLKGVSIPSIYHEDSMVANLKPVAWIATNGAGLLRMEAGNITSYTTDCGMASNNIYQIIKDNRETLWLMSDIGILRITKKQLKLFADGTSERVHCTSFGVADGMPSREFNNAFSRHSIMQSGNGELWFITKKGISRVNPLQLGVNKIPPPVIIENVSLDQKTIAFPGAGQQEIPSYKSTGPIGFVFTAPAFTAPRKISFKYRLEGLEKNWVYLPPGKERKAWYKNPGPGTFKFHVLAANEEGIGNREGASFSFRLLPYFYQTPLFQVIMFLMVFLLAAGFLYIHKRQRRKNKNRYKGSSINPEFAAQCIKKLNYLMEVEKRYKDENISLQSLAKEISIHPHILSQLLNENLKRHFSDFINFHRIEDAKKQLQSSKNGQQKIIQIAFDVGFNTKVAFYNAFKKYTRMTPTQFRNKVRKKEKKSKEL